MKIISKLQKNQINFQISDAYDKIIKENGQNSSKEALTMAVKIKTQTGTIEISNEVIATVVGGAATDIYGIVGMASKNQIKDNLNDILGKENYSRGVVVRQEDNGVAIDVYTIVSYGTKISEVSRNVQESVKYNLETMLGITANSVNVLVQGVRVLPE